MRFIKIVILLFALHTAAFAQTDSTHKSTKKILLVPYPSMMYFSDADQDLARYSKLDEPKLRGQIRVKLENSIYHQLLGAFDAVSLLSATSLNGEQDLKYIYAASRYYLADQKNAGKYSSNLFKRKNKKQALYTTDSTTMLADIGSPDLMKTLRQKYTHDYMLYITQVEINTSNKNTIEWMKQDYKRTFVVHYNLLDASGRVILAETIYLEGGNENTLTEINEKYFTEIAQKLRDILKSKIN